jgi:hypothetical protein
MTTKAAPSLMAKVGLVVAVFAALFTGWQAWIARDIAQRQLRAYVSGNPDYIFTFNPTIPVQIRFTLSNHGQTPAYAMANAAVIEILPYPLSKTDPLPPIPALVESTFTLHPNMTFFGTVSAARTFSQAEITRAIHNDGLRIYILGLIEYKDAFGRVRSTRYCRSVVGTDHLAEVAKGIPGPDRPMQYELCIPHNDAT